MKESARQVSVGAHTTYKYSTLDHKYATSDVNPIKNMTHCRDACADQDAQGAFTANLIRMANIASLRRVYIDS